MFIISIILMIGGAIAAVTGYISITAIHLDSIYGLFEVGLIALVIGFALFMYSLVKKINENKKVPVLLFFTGLLHFSYLGRNVINQ